MHKFDTSPPFHRRSHLRPRRQSRGPKFPVWSSGYCSAMAAPKMVSDSGISFRDTFRSHRPSQNQETLFVTLSLELICSTE